MVLEKALVLNVIRSLLASKWKTAAPSYRKEIEADADIMYDAYMESTDIDGYIVADLPMVFYVIKEDNLPC